MRSVPASLDWFSSLHLGWWPSGHSGEEEKEKTLQDSWDLRCRSSLAASTPKAEPPPFPLRLGQAPKNLPLFSPFPQPAFSEIQAFFCWFLKELMVSRVAEKY